MNNILFISMFVLLPIAIIIAVVLIRSGKKKKKKKNEIISVYRDIVLSDHLEISDELILYDKIFAVDEKKKVFIFLRNHNSPVYDIIQLSGLSDCQVEKMGTNLVAKNQERSVSEFHVNEIHLSFLLSGSVLTNLIVYSEILDGQQEYVSLSKIAGIWQEKINKIIHS